MSIEPTLLEQIKWFKAQIITTFIIFLISVLIGYYLVDVNFIKEIVNEFKNSTDSVIKSSEISQFLWIFTNNAKVALLEIILGALSLFILVANAIILIGGFAKLFILNGQDLNGLLLGMTPHGILELPAIILSAALGLKFTSCFLAFIKKQTKRMSLLNPIHLFKQLKKDNEFKLNFRNIYQITFRLIIPMILIAAFIEVFISAKFLEIYFPQYLR